MEYPSDATCCTVLNHFHYVSRSKDAHYLHNVLLSDICLLDLLDSLNYGHPIAGKSVYRFCYNSKGIICIPEVPSSHLGRDIVQFKLVPQDISRSLLNRL